MRMAAQRRIGAVTRLLRTAGPALRRQHSSAPAGPMRAVQVWDVGPAETALALSSTVGVPTPGPGQVLVRNALSGVNFHDTYTRSGLYPREPGFTVGCEGGGEVVAVADDLGEAGPQVGERVVYYCEGSYAEYSAVPAAMTAAVPQALSLEAATALTVQGLTAHYLTRSTAVLSADDDVIVTAAAGGTGKLVVQMAKMAGARVLGLVSTEAKAEIAAAHGCDDTLIYRQPGQQGCEDFSGFAREWSRDGAGVSVVYDSIGKATAAASLASLRPRGTCVFFVRRALLCPQGRQSWP